MTRHHSIISNLNLFISCHITVILPNLAHADCCYQPCDGHKTLSDAPAQLRKIMQILFLRCSTHQPKSAGSQRDPDEISAIITEQLTADVLVFACCIWIFVPKTIPTHEKLELCLCEHVLPVQTGLLTSSRSF